MAVTKKPKKNKKKKRLILLAFSILGRVRRQAINSTLQSRYCHGGRRLRPGIALEEGLLAPSDHFFPSPGTSEPGKLRGKFATENYLWALNKGHTIEAIQWGGIQKKWNEWWGDPKIFTK